MVLSLGAYRVHGSAGTRSQRAPPRAVLPIPRRVVSIDTSTARPDEHVFGKAVACRRRGRIRRANGEPIHAVPSATLCPFGAARWSARRSDFPVRAQAEQDHTVRHHRDPDDAPDAAASMRARTPHPATETEHQCHSRPQATMNAVQSSGDSAELSQQPRNQQ